MTGTATTLTHQMVKDVIDEFMQDRTWRIDKLEAENAKLREALRRMHHWVSVDLHDCGEDDCELCIDMARARALLEEK